MKCADVRFVKELYPRLKPHDDVVERYRDALDQLPPIVVARGGVLFADLGCARCHSLAGQGSPASPLDDACRHRAPAELRDFIVAATSVESRLPPRAVAAKARYRALGRSDLEALGAALCASAQTTR